MEKYIAFKAFNGEHFCIMHYIRTEHEEMPDLKSFYHLDNVEVLEIVEGSYDPTHVSVIEWVNKKGEKVRREYVGGRPALSQSKDKYTKLYENNPACIGVF